MSLYLQIERLLTRHGQNPALISPKMPCMMELRRMIRLFSPTLYQLLVRLSNLRKE